MPLTPYPVRIQDLDGAYQVDIGIFDGDDCVAQVGYLTRHDPHDYLAGDGELSADDLTEDMDSRIVELLNRPPEEPLVESIREANGL